VTDMGRRDRADSLFDAERRETTRNFGACPALENRGKWVQGSRFHATNAGPTALVASEEGSGAAASLLDRLHGGRATAFAQDAQLTG
jgi:hypothetical protein